MRSTVNWAVLGLVIEKPSYGYELLQRFGARYGELLRVSSPSHVYAALNRLEREKLIEPAVEGDGQPDGPAVRQPKVPYRATPDGARAFRRWLADRMRDDEQRLELMGRLLAVGARRAEAFHDVVDRYEHECVEAARRIPLSHPAAGAEEGESDKAFMARLVTEERRFALEAQLNWIEFARQEMDARERRRDAPDA